MNILHIMPIGSPVYNENIIKMINYNKTDFMRNKHKFILVNESNRNLIYKYENVEFNSNILKGRLKNFNKICSDYDYIFLHSLSLNNKQMFFLKKENLKKIVWCIWGHDLYKKNNFEKKILSFKNLKILINKILFLEFKRKVKKFYAIALGFKYDSLKVREIYGEKIKILNAPYGIGYTNYEIDKILNKNKLREKNTIKIMIGHSGYSFLNHENLLKKLFKYKDENIIISIPLSYGEDKYINKIKNISKNLFKEKIEIIDNMMSLDEYLEYLSTVDIAIFDYKHQAALANITVLQYMNKKIYLNEDGILYKFMKNEGIKTFNVQDIGKLPFKELIKVEYFDNKKSTLSECFLNEKNILNLWKKVFQDLEKSGGKLYE